MVKIVCLLAFLAVNLPQSVSGGAFQSLYAVKVNEKFKVELISNPSTGFGWYIVRIDNQSCIDTVGHSYESSLAGMPSVGGKEVFEFKAMSKGSAKIVLHYKRPWEKKKPAQVKEINVEVN